MICRTIAALLPAVAVSLFAPLAQAAPLRAVYVAYEERTLWEPIALEDVEPVIEHAALEPLSSGGVLQLTKIALKDLPTANADVVVRIVGRMVEEAETHTIHVSVEGMGQSDLGSLRAARSVVIGKLPRDVMRKRIEDSTREAASEVVTALQRILVVTPPKNEGLPKPPPGLTWQWGDVKLPDLPKGVGNDLWSKDYEKRGMALRQLTSELRYRKDPRPVLERCALQHPDAEVRLACLVALRGEARENVGTQQVVIRVFRQDDDGKVLDEASDQMLYFSGMSHAEAVQAWLERTAKDGVQRGPVKELGDVANLDAVIANCLWNTQKLPEYARSKRGCIELLEPLSVKRRRAILWPYLKERNSKSPYYLEGAGTGERSSGTDWQWALESVVEATCRLDKELADVMWSRYERDLSAAALELYAEYALPEPVAVERLLTAVQNSGENRAIWGLERMAEIEPKLLPAIQDKVAEMQATGMYHKSVRMKDLVEKFSRLAKKAAER